MHDHWRCPRLRAQRAACCGPASCTAASLAPTHTQERRRKRAELLQLLAERQAELDRLAAEEASLLRVRQEQELMLAKLADAGGS